MVTVDGLAARFYVRAAMHPLYAHERILYVTVKKILNGTLSSTKPLTPSERSHVAAEALRGWQSRHPEVDSPRTIWHRAFGDTRILVGVGDGGKS